MRRRRVLGILAAAALARPATAQDWRGTAFGADVALHVQGEAPMAEILAEIAAIEATFSLFADSELGRLNAAGAVVPSPRMRTVLGIAQRVHRATAGCFDPTVQPLWRALAQGRDPGAARQAIGFGRLRMDATVRLAPGQALTLNGIVQGYAADRIVAILARHGFGQALVDMGEFSALGGPFRIGIEDPAAGFLGTRRVGGAGMRAVATSSPAALALPGGSHILGPRGEAPLWSTVSVEGPSAALCDAASTAFVLMPRAAIDRARAELGLGAVILVDATGDLTVMA